MTADSLTRRNSAWWFSSRDRVATSAVSEVARLVLEVVPGERRLRPDFGWRAPLLPPLDREALSGVASLLAEEDLARWVPDLGVRGVQVEDVDHESLLLVLHCDDGPHKVRVRRRGRLGEGSHERGEF